MINKFMMVMLATILCLSFVSGAVESLGTFKQDDCVQLKQTCPSCSYVNFSSVVYPNSTNAQIGIASTQSGTEYTADFCNANVTGEYIVNGVGDVDGIDTVFAYNFDVTSTGKPTPTGIPFVLMGMFVIVFGVACFFLFVSTQTQELGPKLFFFIGSFVFLIGSIGLATVVANDNNVSSSISNTMTAIMFSLGMIIVFIFMFTLVKVVFSIVEIMNQKKGYGFAPSSQHTFQSYQNPRGWDR